MMSEGTDPPIKLFGRTIPLLDPPEEAEKVEEGEAAVELGVDVAALAAEPAEGEKDSCKEVTNMEVNNSSSGTSDDGNEDIPASSSGLNNSNENDHKVPIEDEKAVSDSKADHTKPDAEDSSQEKILKKPDKILPCPRCKSRDTKFCYYNNYNINQPRHFCKNCQRYWTAGGTMRNVPVGAGRRKSKHTSSQYRQIMVPSDGFQPARLENSSLAHCQALPCRPSAPTRTSNENGTILKFGTEVPLCESMASALSINEKVNKCDFSSKLHGENKEEPSCASSITASNFRIAGNSVSVEHNGMQGYYNGMRPMPEFQCYPLAACAYPWNPGWTSVAPMMTGRCLPEFVHTPESGNPTAVPWSHPTMVASPALCSPLPFPYMPASFWGCISNWPTGPLNVPWFGFNNNICQSSSTSNSGCSENGSPTLGKHSRDVCLQSEEKMEKSLWVPKTLRIDDPNEAAKSSIWATLGIKPEVGIFKPFQSKAENKAQTSGAAQVLQANPAALSRSESFQENT